MEGSNCRRFISLLLTLVCILSLVTLTACFVPKNSMDPATVKKVLKRRYGRNFYLIEDNRKDNGEGTLRFENSEGVVCT
jgi:hypothetical protein